MKNAYCMEEICRENGQFEYNIFLVIGVMGFYIVRENLEFMSVVFDSSKSLP